MPKDLAEEEGGSGEEKEEKQKQNEGKYHNTKSHLIFFLSSKSLALYPMF